MSFLVCTQTIYLKIKYKDDGRELVSWLEFVTIHMTFPALNAWITYLLLYQFSIAMILQCPYDNRMNPTWLCTGGDKEAPN